MNIYVLGSPYKTARLLSNEERMKHLCAAQRVMSAINKGDFSDPRVAQYKGHMQWIKYYMLCLNSYRHNHPTAQKIACMYSDMAYKIRPIFHTSEYFKLCDEYLGRNMDFNFYYDTETESIRFIPAKTAPKSGKFSLLSRFVEKVKKFIDKTAERL